jgi:hypothetical protein
MTDADADADRSLKVIDRCTRKRQAEHGGAHQLGKRTRAELTSTQLGGP